MAPGLMTLFCVNICLRCLTKSAFFALLDYTVDGSRA